MSTETIYGLLGTGKGVEEGDYRYNIQVYVQSYHYTVTTRMTPA